MTALAEQLGFDAGAYLAWELEQGDKHEYLGVASRVIMFREGVILCSSPARFSSGSPRSLRAARHVRTEHEKV